MSATINGECSLRKNYTGFCAFVWNSYILPNYTSCMCCRTLLLTEPISCHTCKSGCWLKQSTAVISSVNSHYQKYHLCLLVPGRSQRSQYGTWPISQRFWVRYPVWPHAFLSPSADSRGRVVSYWQKYVHEVLVNCFGGLSLPRKSVVRLTDCSEVTLDVYHDVKQQQPLLVMFMTEVLINSHFV